MNNTITLFNIYLNIQELNELIYSLQTLDKHYKKKVLEKYSIEDLIDIITQLPSPLSSLGKIGAIDAQFLYKILDQFTANDIKKIIQTFSDLVNNKQTEELQDWLSEIFLLLNISDPRLIKTIIYFSLNFLYKKQKQNFSIKKIIGLGLIGIVAPPLILLYPPVFTRVFPFIKISLLGLVSPITKYSNSTIISIIKTIKWVWNTIKTGIALFSSPAFWIGVLIVFIIGSIIAGLIYWRHKNKESFNIFMSYLKYFGLALKETYGGFVSALIKMIILYVKQGIKYTLKYLNLLFQKSNGIIDILKKVSIFLIQKIGDVVRIILYGIQWIIHNIKELFVLIPELIKSIKIYFESLFIYWKHSQKQSITYINKNTVLQNKDTKSTNLHIPSDEEIQETLSANEEVKSYLQIYSDYWSNYIIQSFTKLKSLFDNILKPLPEKKVKQGIFKNTISHVLDIWQKLFDLSMKWLFIPKIIDKSIFKFFNFLFTKLHIKRKVTVEDIHVKQLTEKPLPKASFYLSKLHHKVVRGNIVLNAFIARTLVRLFIKQEMLKLDISSLNKDTFEVVTEEAFTL